MQFMIEWQPIQQPLPIEEQATYAALGLCVGQTAVLRHEDLIDLRPIQEHIHVSSYPLALWLVANWWRLRWEAALPDSASTLHKHDWLMSHSMGAVGHGYDWPDLTFTSDTQSIALQHKLHENALGRIKYLQAFSASVDASQFQQAAFSLIEQTVQQLDAQGVQATDLHHAWAALQQELGHTGSFRYRQLEAQLGFDVDESEEGYISRLLQAETQFGSTAVDEITQAEKDNTLQALQDVREQLSLSKSTISFKETTLQPKLHTQAQQPWEKGRAMAQALREVWAIDSDKLSNEQIADRLHANKNLWAELSQQEGSLAVAHTQTAGSTSTIVLGKSRPEAQRFMLARIVGDHLFAANTKDMLVCTIGKTYRQKYQRAFAQELLCPYSALVSWLNTVQPNEEAISQAAEYFSVSPLLVQTVLVNKGHLPSSHLLSNY